MSRIISMAFLCAALSACGSYNPPDTARMPMTPQGALVINESDAIDLVEYQLGRPDSTHGNLELAARAVAAEDWLAGQTGLNGDYGNYAPAVRVPWVQFRQEVRAAIGVAPGTPSQTVVDRLLIAAAALKRGDRPTAVAQLQPPAFTLGGEATLAALDRLPAFAGYGPATSELQSYLHRSSRCTILPFC